MNRKVILASLFWFEWTMGYSLGLGFGWYTARPLAIDLADAYGPVAGVATFLCVLGGIVHLIQLPLLAQVALRPGVASGPPTVKASRFQGLASVAFVSIGSIAGLVSLMRSGLFYGAFLGWIVVLAVVRETLASYWHTDFRESLRRRSTWFKPWVSIVVLVLLVSLAILAEPWQLGDTCRTCGHVPAVVVGGLVGGVTGLVLLRRGPSAV